jgi:four helix bundle protein
MSSDRLAAIIDTLWEISGSSPYGNPPHQLALDVHRSTASFPSSERYALAAQMRRAAVSAVSHIAEGCGRQSDRELIYFLRIARGSVRELESQLCLAYDLGYLNAEVWRNFEATTEEISKMLTGFIHTVRNTLKDTTPSS